MKLSQLEQLEMKLKKMKNSTLLPLIITLFCATQTSYANDAVVAKNISANSLKQLDRSTAGKYGEYSFKYDIDASPDIAVISTEGNKCCATVATKYFVQIEVLAIVIIAKTIYAITLFQVHVSIGFL